MIECDWIHVDERCVMGNARNLGLVGWRSAPLADDMRRWRSFGHTLCRTYPEGSACIDLVVSGTPSFSSEMRKESEQFASDAKIFPNGIAHIVLLEGLAGTAARAFISTVLLVARTPTPSKSFADSRTAAPWLRERLGKGWSEVQIFDAYRALAAKLAERP